MKKAVENQHKILEKISILEKTCKTDTARIHDGPYKTHEGRWKFNCSVLGDVLQTSPTNFLNFLLNFIDTLPPVFVTIVPYNRAVTWYIRDPLIPILFAVILIPEPHFPKNVDR